MRYILLLLVLCSIAAQAQQLNIQKEKSNNNAKDSLDFNIEDIENLDMNITVPDSLQDDSWIADSLNLDNLDIDTLQFDVYDVDNYFEYFPHFSTDEILKGFYISPSVKYFNRANNIMPKGFFPAKNPFADNRNLEDDIPELKSGFDNNEEDDGFISSYFELGLSYIVTSSYFVPIHLQLGYQSITSSIYSLNESKMFRDYDNQIVTFKEANIIRLKEHFAQVTVAAELPIWGIGKLPSITSFASYYYGLIGISGQFSISSKADQIMQLLSEDDKIRYSNGNNFTYLLEDQTVQNINSFRSHLVFGFGMNNLTNFGGFSVSFQYKYPLNSIIKDTDWKHHYYVLQFEFFKL